MPYQVIKVPGGCKVKKVQPGRPRWFSRKALPCKKAKAQQAALYIAERKRSMKTRKVRRFIGASNQ